MWLRASKLILAAAILAGCSAPKPVTVDKAFKVCSEEQDPKIDNCKKPGPTAPITIRGYHE